MNKSFYTIFIFIFSINVFASNSLGYESYYRLTHLRTKLSNYSIKKQNVKSQTISIYFGNDDLNGKYNEQLIKAWSSILQKSCLENLELCNFKKISNNTFKKNKLDKVINLKLIMPTTSNEKVTKTNFLKSLSSDNVVIYLGHSRYGQGPDFFPSNLNSKYAVSPQQMAKEINNDLKIILLSCSSQEHFFETLDNNKNWSNLLLTTKAISYSTSEKTAFVALDFLLKTNNVDSNIINDFFKNNLTQSWQN